MNSKVKKSYHELISTLKNASPNPSKHSDSYGGNEDKKLHLRVPVIRSVAKEFVKNHPGFSVEEWSELLLFLSKGKFDEEKQIIGKILKNNKDLRRNINLKTIEKVLSEMEGWSQVDSTCQSVFDPKDMLARWNEWKELIKKLSENQNFNMKRASLVLLTAPVKRKKDKRFSDLAFWLIDKLKNEEDKLITKAISWLLREMIKNYREEVENYLEKNEESLPKIAVRETKNKLETGKKN